MKKAKYLAIALAVSLGMVMLACGQPVGYVSDNNEAAQTFIPLLASPPAATSVTETAFDTDTTDHYINMPATVNAGDLLIVLFTNDGSATVATPDGWSSLASDVNGSAVRLSVYYKIAAGTEGGTTVNLVTSAGEQAAAQVYRITDWNGTTPPEISTAATDATPAPNPVSLNPAGWDVTDTLWLAVGGQDRGDQSGTTTYPASYTDGIGTLSSDVLGSCRTLSARRVHATASENPGAFTIPVSEEWVAFTIAVRPPLRDLTISSTAGGSVTTPGEGVFTYDEGTVVDVVATPVAGYRFVNWTGNVSAVEDVYGAETTVTVNGDCAVTANFVAMYDLTISIFSTGGGSVIEPGEGVFTYDEGSVVDLVAIPDAGYRFVEWTGDVGAIADVHDASTTITMNGNYAVTANFVAIYDLTISSTEGGSVIEPGEGVFTYDKGTVVDLVVIPDAGYRFVEWTGDVGTIADVHDASTTITMNGDYAVTANFVAIYDLTISSTAGGSVTTPGEGVFTYDEGTVVDLVVIPDAGYRFVEWTGDVGTIADVHDASTTITMNGDYAVTANFVAIYDLTISSTAGGSVTTPGEGVFTYDEGTVVDLVVIPDAGYRFVEWTGDVGTIADVHDASTTITMNGDYAVTANFVAIYDLTISSTAGGSVTTPGEGVFTYDEGTVVDLVVIPDAGYRFVEWTGDVGTIADVHDASTTITMNGDYAVTANFVAIYDLTISSTEGGSVTTPGEGVFTYDEGTVVDLVVIPDAGYRFVEWTGDVGTIADVHDASTTITMNGDYAVTANFVAIYDLTISGTAGGSVTTPGEGVFTYDEGTVVDLVVIPDAGYRFVEWTGDVGTIADVHDASTTITMNGDYAVTANFVAIYDLTISSTAGGSVTTPGEGVFTYDEGTVVDLVVIPDAGYRFVEWTGDVGTIADVHDASTTITMNGDYAVTANFVAIYDLTISSTAGGSVTTPGEGVFTYDEGTVVDLVVIPDAGYRFVEWTGDVGTIADVHDASTTITMNGDYAVTANFVAIYDLTISSTKGGSVTTPGEGTFACDTGMVVSLVARPLDSYRFVNWTGDVGAIADVYDATTTITMNGDYAITANFVATYDLTISSTEGGSVTQPGQGRHRYDKGRAVHLVATPVSGYRFVNWTGSVGTVANVNDATTTITMNGDYSISANFVAIYDLSIASTKGVSVIEPGEGVFIYDEGTVVDLVVEAEEDYRFVEWTGDVGTIADVYDATTTITMNGDYSISANFVAIYDLSIASTKGVSVIEPGEGVFTYDEGTVVDLVVEAEEDYRFVEWTGDVGTIADVYAAETTITMNDDYSITANFEQVPPSQVYPTVTTQAATNITTSSTRLNMSYTVGDFSPVEVCFAYKKSTDSAWSYTAWVSKTADGTHAEVFTGLDFNTAYHFKSRLKYNGTVVGGTTLQFTTDTPSPSGSGGCFIATAAYGTPTAKQIDLLREFRDVVLLKSTVGSQFVALYYRLSPPIADFIAGNELLTTLVRELLVDPIVWVVQATGIHGGTRIK